MAKPKPKRKPGRPKKVHAGGRPTKMIPETVKKLEEAFAMGCTDTEACIFADITRQTLTTYQNANPKFLDRKNLLKETPVLTARNTVVKNIKEDSNLAFKYLERKRRDEFGPSEKIDHTVKVGPELSAEESELAKEAVDYVLKKAFLVKKDENSA